MAGVIAQPAYADVLEIGDDGPSWISGPNVTLNAPDSAAVPDNVDIEVPASAVADLQRHSAGIPATYSAKVAELSARFDLSPALIEALVWQESRWRSNAKSSAGARGLTQLMPGTARELGVDPGDPFANLEGGARYLREQIDRFDGDIEKALAAYNAGPKRVLDAGGIPEIRETKHYVASVIGRLADHSRSSN
ncbi:transglycosylase SLT domain-containing protein [Altererythrobacter indicus]|uniref:Transglycosylase SLT domain-containing protein n=2 Tax=Altericroceibacterium indicum TaxID=374177 RepID=A0A845A841_9SPHN|nr:lytic transglycosylase domain-containing protein [Altericroceibacterium indicum]MXP25005.1 transglycosylase SLT domain-containing protein [Altericroceibacterium indicum]